MIDLTQVQCVGCTACVSVCPKNVIVMQRNAEGFDYPYIAQKEACIECGLCEKVCPSLNGKEEIPFPQTALIAQIKDEDVRRESASGGMFSAIALAVLAENGVVFGAAYDDCFTVRHMGIEKKEDLWKLRNSKYVQSNLDGVFAQVKQLLLAGRVVCFSGTPCQIEGLQGYLQKDYANLLLVDVVCHGVSSPLIWERYLETITHHKPRHIYFRWKHYGYKYSTMSLFDHSRNEIYYAGVESDKMLRAYFTNSCDRETCYSCAFKKRYRTSDFTIWDCFQPRVFNKRFDDDRGTSAVLVHTDKGRDCLNKILALDLIAYQAVSADDLTFGNHEMVGSVKRGEKRDALLRDAAHLDGETLFNTHFPDTTVSKMKKMVRLFLVRTGLYRTFKYWLFAYRRKQSKK